MNLYFLLPLKRSPSCLSSLHNMKNMPATERQSLKKLRPNERMFLCGTGLIFEGHTERYESYVPTSRRKHKAVDLLPVNLRPRQLRSWLFLCLDERQEGFVNAEKSMQALTCKMKVSITSHFAGDAVSLQRGRHLKSRRPPAWKQLALSQTHLPGLTYWFLGLRAPSPLPPRSPHHQPKAVSRQEPCRPSGPITQQCTCLLMEWMKKTKPQKSLQKLFLIYDPPGP